MFRSNLLAFSYILIRCNSNALAGVEPINLSKYAHDLNFSTPNTSHLNRLRRLTVCLPDSLDLTSAQERPSPNQMMHMAQSSYFHKIYKFPYFRKIFEFPYFRKIYVFPLTYVFFPLFSPIMHVCIMLYSHWTPLPSILFWISTS